MWPTKTFNGDKFLISVIGSIIFVHEHRAPTSETCHQELKAKADLKTREFGLKSRRKGNLILVT